MMGMTRGDIVVCVFIVLALAITVPMPWLLSASRHTLLSGRDVIPRNATLTPQSPAWSSGPASLTDLWLPFESAPRVQTCHYRVFPPALPGVRAHDNDKNERHANTDKTTPDVTHHSHTGHLERTDGPCQRHRLPPFPQTDEVLP
ncbi:hypothetical protein LC20_03225 [Yersinia hibernica]|uniref:Uncharacterized protein n=1 Tax=Yersinia enterocolitica LC20 TaxID=1443113 RepID=A0A7U4GG46_YEREN|nr:hypothetical protein LC20_03225 [Yersinia hibernica]